MNIVIIQHLTTTFDYFKHLLSANHYNIVSINTLEGLSQRLNTLQPDCLLIDPTLFEESSVDYHETIQETTSCPYIIFSEDFNDTGIADALNQGAADFLKLPLGDLELLARINRVILYSLSKKEAKRLSFNDNHLQIVTDTKEVYLNNEAITLTKTEFDILYTLATNPQRIFNRGELMESIRGLEFKGSDRAIDSHVKNLRIKIEPDSKSPTYILTIHGRGYRFGNI